MSEQVTLLTGPGWGKSQTRERRLGLKMASMQGLLLLFMMRSINIRIDVRTCYIISMCE